MTEQSHTPVGRNWRWVRKGSRVVSDPHGVGGAFVVADVSVSGMCEDQLNFRGRLIAAAPELLEALKTARDYVTDAIQNADDPTFHVGLSMRTMMADDLARIDAAIAKATGGAQ